MYFVKNPYHYAFNFVANSKLFDEAWKDSNHDSREIGNLKDKENMISKWYRLWRMNLFTMECDVADRHLMIQHQTPAVSWGARRGEGEETKEFCYKSHNTGNLEILTVSTEPAPIISHSLILDLSSRTHCFVKHCVTLCNMSSVELVITLLLTTWSQILSSGWNSKFWTRLGSGWIWKRR